MVLSSVGPCRDAVAHICGRVRPRTRRREVTGTLIRLLLVKLSRPRRSLDVFSRAGQWMPPTKMTVLGSLDPPRRPQTLSRTPSIARSAYREFPARVRTATTLARLLAASPDRSLRDGERALRWPPGCTRSSDPPPTARASRWHWRSWVGVAKRRRGCSARLPRPIAPAMPVPSRACAAKRRAMRAICADREVRLSRTPPRLS